MDMLQEYQEQLKRTRALKRNLPDETAADKDRHKILAGMITDLEIAVFCLETGMPPGFRNKGIYGKIPLDPSVMAAVFAAPDPFDEVETRIDKERMLQHA